MYLDPGQKKLEHPRTFPRLARPLLRQSALTFGIVVTVVAITWGKSTRVVSTEFGPMLAMIRPISTFRPVVGRLRPNLRNLDRTLFDFRRNRPELDQSLSIAAELVQHFGRLRSNLGVVDRFVQDFGQSCPGFGQIRSTQIWAAVAESGAHIGRLRPTLSVMSTDCGRNSAKVGPSSTMLGPLRPNLAATWPSFDNLWPVSARFGSDWISRRASCSTPNPEIIASELSNGSTGA